MKIKIVQPGKRLSIKCGELKDTNKNLPWLQPEDCHI
jgi:hypothetical protein